MIKPTKRLSKILYLACGILLCMSLMTAVRLQVQSSEVLPGNPEMKVPSHDPPLVFHLLHMNDPHLFGERQLKTVESIFFHHPSAPVVIHSPTLPMEVFQPLLKKGYNLSIRSDPGDSVIARLNRLQTDPDFLEGPSLNPHHASAKELIGSFVQRMDDFANDGTNHWPAHHADLLRMLLLYFEGGIYVDTDVIVVQALDKLPWNSIGYEDKGALNQAVLKFHPKHIFLRESLWEFLTTFDNTRWGYNGPELVTRIYNRLQPPNDTFSLSSTEDAQEQKAKLPEPSKLSDPNRVHAMPRAAFYYFRWRIVAKDCFQHTKRDKVEKRIRSIASNRTFVVHWYHHQTLDTPIIEGSACYCLFHSFCVVSECNNQLEICKPLLDAH